MLLCGTEQCSLSLKADAVCFSFFLGVRGKEKITQHELGRIGRFPVHPILPCTKPSCSLVAELQDF
jgi:hypothetical protein